MIQSYHKYREYFPEEKSFPVVFFQKISKFRKSALIDKDNPQRVSFQKFTEMTISYENYLFPLLHKNRHPLVVTICGNSLKFLSIVLAITKLGFTVLPLNPALKQYEVKNSLAGLDINTIITDNLNAHKFLLKTYQMLSFENILESLITSECKSRIVKRNHPAFVFFSSGTTGKPKAIEISHGSLIAHFNQLNSSLEESQISFNSVNENDSVYGVLPYFHLGGLFTAISMLFLGATLYINEKWNSDSFIEKIISNKITALNVVPPVLQVLLKIEHDLPYLKKVYVGASPVDVKVLERLKTVFPTTNFIQLFGMTEAGLIIFMTSTENNDISNIGVPFPGVQAKVLDQELLIKTPTIMTRYLHETVPCDRNQWFHTGDLVEVYNKDQLRVIGRTKSLIKVRGWQINPEEVEKMIADRSEVSESVLHYSTFKNSTRLILQTSGKPENVRDTIEENLISYKHPFWIIQTNQCSKTESGKIKRNNFDAIMATL